MVDGVLRVVEGLGIVGLMGWLCRAFSPLLYFVFLTQGVALGWDNGAPSALGECRFDLSFLGGMRGWLRSRADSGDRHVSKQESADSVHWKQ